MIESTERWFAAIARQTETFLSLRGSYDQFRNDVLALIDAGDVSSLAEVTQIDGERSTPALLAADIAAMEAALLAMKSHRSEIVRAMGVIQRFRSGGKE